MPECSYDPIRRRYHGWKKTLVGPIERFCLRRAKALVATCDAEKSWIQDYLGNHCPPVEVTDIKRFFKLNPVNPVNPVQKPLHILYLGRRNPLKGLTYLETAVRQLSSVPSSLFPVPPQLKVVSNAFGDELEKIWDWCDVLVLPTLSDNFGLVIAEALERGKRVITTDGAPAWAPSASATEDKSDGTAYGGRLTYICGFRESSDARRVELLKAAICAAVS